MHIKSNHIIFGLSASKKLTESVCSRLGIEPGDITIQRFADGEIFVRPDCTLRNKDVIFIQSTNSPVNDNLMELLVAIDSAKRASAKSITALMPYYGYARQDRKSAGREPITSKLVADLITKAGADRVTLTDIHSDQTQGFFDIPVDTLKASFVLLCHVLVNNKIDDLVVVSPDYGGVKRARKIAESINVPLAIIDKRRPKPNVAESINILGEVSNKCCILVDDMIDTGGTIMSAAKLLHKNGAKKVLVMATHGLLNKNAIELFDECYKNKEIDEIYITDTIDQSAKNLKDKKQFKVVKLDHFYSLVLEAYMNGGSISDVYTLYQEWAKSPDLKKILENLE
ncbi:ribose-phosphate diphosphokinase [Mycoplasma bradburyae]|uniref:Ribose-phosphate pyrophosphokinase n=1 Tax=Mycoplasma bradburyae TaxID=2963128 RepID=A0AAW6HP28_9MOLU|nr:ribose-phosphate diphosphokinase [Mycoplasma bradburyae]MDC4181616.1 ribose-phosphate diphosphokinase [Mycoplasma bradburyae]MDC4182343.1 ribose-phosphate diphosphokinase [Mycoplasma bradburyae]MDC4183069.1 ribose-phosphate diphosphokinase [Mycoplasma bradburyae]MDC4183787.1 ribose-phosphate diphosphokinase [Mycoplasma bradburyae]UTS69962.1 ribose-phosphate diphosphokinase [Mycoplasma bradburyae]